MTRRSRYLYGAIAIWMLSTVAIGHAAPASASGPEFSYQDRFDDGKYNGNNGLNKFTEGWFEYLDWGGPNDGFVTANVDDGCHEGGCAQIAGTGKTFRGTGLARGADLMGVASAEFRFKYSVVVNQGSDGRLDIAVLDRERWHVIDSIPVAESTDGAMHSKAYDVTLYASHGFAVGFFASGSWDAVAYIDDVAISGHFEKTTTTTVSTTTLLPTTTTLLPTSTTLLPTSTTLLPTSTTLPPSTTPRPTTTLRPTTTTTAATTTTEAPATTTVVPSTTVIRPTTTAPPAVTTTVAPIAEPPTPVVIVAPPTSTQAPVTLPPLDQDARYLDKGALTLTIAADMMEMPTDQGIRPPGPVTQLMASVTTTAITVRSHLLPTMALGLLIAVAAVWGLGKRQTL